jgi:hypothetical protein
MKDRTIPTAAFAAACGILCVIRNKMAQSTSSDVGLTWSKPHTIPFHGDAPNLLYTSKGLLLCAMRHKGTSAIISSDDGKTWPGANIHAVRFRPRSDGIDFVLPAKWR